MKSILFREKKMKQFTFPAGKHSFIHMFLWSLNISIEMFHDNVFTDWPQLYETFFSSCKNVLPKFLLMQPVPFATRSNVKAAWKKKRKIITRRNFQNSSISFKKCSEPWTRRRRRSIQNFTTKRHRSSLWGKSTASQSTSVPTTCSKASTPSSFAPEWLRTLRISFDSRTMRTTPTTPSTGSFTSITSTWTMTSKPPWRPYG